MFLREDCRDEFIEQANFSYNTAVHESTGYTPHYLVFGHTAKIPSNLNFEEDPETYNSHLTNLFERIYDLQESVRANLLKTKERSKTYYDKYINQIVFRANEYVFLINERKTGKFSREYFGPYRIIKILDHENVKIKIGNSMRIVHINNRRLRKACYGDEPGYLVCYRWSFRFDSLDSPGPPLQWPRRL